MSERDVRHAAARPHGGPVRIVWVWGPAVAAMSAIFFASSLSDLPPATEQVSDKVLHVVAYAVLGLLVLRAMADARWERVLPPVGLRAWLFTLAYGLSDEFHQWFVANRTAAVDDWLADAAGSGIAIVLALLWARQGRARRSV